MDIEKQREYHRNYFHKNKIKILSKKKEDRKQNPEKYKTLSKKRWKRDKETKREEINKKARDYRKKNPEKQKIADKKYRENPKNKEKIKLKDKIIRNRKINWLKNYKKTIKCSKCGEDNPICLDFHHINPGEKKGLISKLVESLSTENLIKEISKCDVLCSNCHRKLHYEECKSNVKEVCGKSQAARRKLGQMVNEIKSKIPCIKCGESDISCLDFHHRNPEEKDKEVTKLILEGVGKQRVLDEIAKCNVLCSNCHRKLHYEERQANSEFND